MASFLDQIRARKAAASSGAPAALAPAASTAPAQQPVQYAAALPSRPVSFAGIRMASGGWNILKTGEYLLEIERTYTHSVPNKSHTWVVQAKVLASTNPQHAEGSTVHILRPRSSPLAEGITLSQVMQLVAACSGANTEDELQAALPDWADLCNAALGSPVGQYGDNPLAGVQVGALATESGKLNKRGQDWGNIKFVPAG